MKADFFRTLLCPLSLTSYFCPKLLQTRKIQSIFITITVILLDKLSLKMYCPAEKQSEHPFDNTETLQLILFLLNASTR